LVIFTEAEAHELGSRGWIVGTHRENRISWMQWDGKTKIEDTCYGTKKAAPTRSALDGSGRVQPTVPASAQAGNEETRRQGERFAALQRTIGASAQVQRYTEGSPSVPHHSAKQEDRPRPSSNYSARREIVRWLRHADYQCITHLPPEYKMPMNYRGWINIAAWAGMTAATLVAINHLMGG
jgi:hypothetical protein